MANMDSDIISVHSDPSSQRRRGILHLISLTSVKPTVSMTIPSRRQPIDPQLSLPENTSRLLRNWLYEFPGSASSILWLSGVPASFGAEDINDLCREHCILAASFSFSSRKGSEQAKELVPALAVQICDNFPSLRHIIGLTVFHNRNIFSADLHAQMEALVFNPFRRYGPMRGDGRSAVLIIDGLELYHDPKIQGAILTSIETVATTLSIPLRFLFTTRQGSHEYGLQLQPGTHIHIRNSPSAEPLSRLKSVLRLGASRRPHTPAYNGFPQLLQTQNSINDAESYTRSLIMLGHGIPLWRPQGNVAAPREYLRQGPQIGDVMYITEEGLFQFVVNIFRGVDEPINSKTDMQAHYEPLTLNPSDVTRVENYFEPGTVITSDGVVAVKQCSNPLSVNFKSNLKEGGILVLPQGASREDMIQPTKRFHQYVQRWAPHWYWRHDVPNGSIFLVTGCDKASDYACATFFSDPSWAGNLEIDMDYVRREDGESPWRGQDRARAHYYKRSESDADSAQTSASTEKAQRFCVFVRGMRIALSSAVWSSYNSGIFADSAVAYANVLHTSPLLGHVTESLLVRLHRRSKERVALRRVSVNSIIFHPIFVLGPDLFQKHLKASVVVVNDSDWSMLTQEGHGDWVHMKALIEKLYQHFSVVEDHGVVSLSPKMAQHKDVKTKRGMGIPHLLRWDRGTVKPIPIGKFVHDLGEIPNSDP